MYNTANIAYNPADLRANKVDRTECKGSGAALTFPIHTAVIRMDDKSALTDCPTVLVGREIDVPDTVPNICLNFVPCLATVVAHRHRATSAHCNRTVGIRKLNIL